MSDRTGVVMFLDALQTIATAKLIKKIVPRLYSPKKTQNL